MSSSGACIGWTDPWMCIFIFLTNECDDNSFTANVKAMKHATTHVFSSDFHIPAPHAMPEIFQRKRFFKRKFANIMLAVVLIASVISRSHAQQVSLQS